MKKTIFILGLLIAAIATETYAFKIVNHSNAEIYAIGTGATSGIFEFGTIPVSGTSQPWLPYDHGTFGNLPATVWVCWYVDKGCSWTNIQHFTSTTVQTGTQNCEGGVVIVTGTHGSDPKPIVTTNQDGKGCK